MAFNYGSLENMLPLFGTIGNGGGMTNHPNFINQLAAAITTAAAGAVNVTPTSTTAVAKRERTPDPPPAPRLRELSPLKMKPNQGTVPMDLENDSDADMVPTPTLTPTPTTKVVDKVVDKMPLNIHDSSLFLNSFLPSGMNSSAYMFFPSAAAATTSATTSQAAGQMLMDPAAMMAAMQQMQQSYATAGYTTALPTAGAEGSVDGTSQLAAEAYTGPAMKEVIKTKSCTLFPPNPNALPPTIRERPPGCRTVFVGGLPENITEEIIREIFESCGEITTLRMSKKNFCHIRYRHEASIDRAIYLSGYRVRISNLNEPANFGRLHVDYAQARDDKYDYECKQRQLQREHRHRERMSLNRIRSQSPPPTPHYTDHEASLVAENLRSNETFVKAIQTIAIWLERGDCTKRNANIFYSMIQSTHAHVRRLYTDKQQLEDDLRKARESYRKQMLTMSTQFTQIEKVFSAASHKKVWDHFTKAQRKNIDQWKKLASELRLVQIEDDEMEMSDDDRDYQSSSAKRARYDSESLKEENDSLRCQLEALRGEMSLVRTDIKYDSDFREKQIKVLQETIRNMQTQLLQTKMREQRDAKTIEQMERKLKEAGVKQLLLKTKIRETSEKLKDKEASSLNSEASEILIDETEDDDVEEVKAKADNEQQSNTEKENKQKNDNMRIIDIDVYKTDDDVKIIEDNSDVVEIHEVEDDEHAKPKDDIEQQGVQLQQSSEKTKDENTMNAENNVNNETDEAEQKLVPEPKIDCKDDEELKILVLHEAKIISLVTAYLVVHPYGACSESICSYLRDIINALELQTHALESILKTYPNLFQAETTTNGNANSSNATAKLKWKFCGFMKAGSETADTKNVVE